MPLKNDICCYLSSLFSLVLHINAHRKQKRSILRAPCFVYFFLPLVVLCSYSSNALATKYYISPTGADSRSGLSIDSPWMTFDHAMTNLNAGDTLFLLDGEYKRSLKVTISGTQGNPITFKALNDGKARVNGQNSRIPLQIRGENDEKHKRYINVDGIVFHNSNADVIEIVRADNINIKRVSAYNADPFSNNSIFTINWSDKILVEDCAGSGPARNLLNTFGSTRVTVRRFWGKWKSYTPDDPTDSPAGVTRGISIYSGRDSLFENNIITREKLTSPGNGPTVGISMTVTGPGIGGRNKLYGNIVYDLKETAYSVATKKGHVLPSPNIFENNVSINNSIGIFVRAGEKGFAKWFTMVGNNSGKMLQVSIDESLESKFDTDFKLNFDLRNSILMTGDRGIDVRKHERIGSVTHVYNDLYKLTQDYFNIAKKHPTEMDIPPRFNVSKYGKGAYLIRSKALSGLGENDANLGAQVLYRYINGNINTNERLWPWPMEARIQAETTEFLGKCTSVTWEDNGKDCTGGLWKVLDNVYPTQASPSVPKGLKFETIP